MKLRAELEREVSSRAADRCEYCRMHQSLQGARFHLEHILPKSRGGPDELGNFAWAYPGCNLKKSDRVEVLDPTNASTVPLFSPRSHSWDEHFEWDDYHLIGTSAIGRAAIAALDLNHERRIRIRQAEQTFGLFPPDQ
jgi:hypothetical protein